MSCLGRCSVTYTVPLLSFLRVSLNVLRRFKLLKIWALSMALDSSLSMALDSLSMALYSLSIALHVKFCRINF